MKPDVISDLLPLFNAVLDGQSYRAAARAFGMTRTTVERRIKACAKTLARESGHFHFNEAELRFVSRLRARREMMIAAASRYRPSVPELALDELALSDIDIVHMADRLRQHSRYALRDVALLLVLFSTGARPLEIARLQISDYLAADGDVREISELRADAAVNGRARPLYFASAKVNAAIDAYLVQRARCGGAGADGSTQGFRGLAPDSGLFLMADGRPFEIICHGGHRRERYLCRGILDVYRSIFRCIGMVGLSPMAARRHVAVRLQQRGATEAQIGEVLGIQAMKAVRTLLARSQKSLPLIMRDFI